MFAAGSLNEQKIGAITTAGAYLNSDERSELDRRIVAHPLPEMGVKRIEGNSPNQDRSTRPAGSAPEPG
ncbi:hypothetical protein [Pseudonocardia thermophila]|nr:hypothetical protein [Pseudonocardia thermophila]